MEKAKAIPTNLRFATFSTRLKALKPFRQAALVTFPFRDGLESGKWISEKRNVNCVLIKVHGEWDRVPRFLFNVCSRGFRKCGLRHAHGHGGYSERQD